MKFRCEWCTWTLVGLTLIPASGQAAGIRTPASSLFQVERTGRYRSPVPSAGPLRPRTGGPKTWVVTPGSLHRELRRWVTQSGYQLVWKSPKDYLLTTRAVLHGPFIRVLAILMRALERAGSPVRATLYLKNRVLIIDRPTGGLQ